MDSLIQKAFENVFEEDVQEKPIEKEEKVEEKPIETNETPSENIEQKIQDEFGLDVMTAKILVMGIGGAGNNCITRLNDIGIKGAQTVAINTDAKHLSISRADNKVLIGRELTRGLGAGGYPNLGRKAAEESERDLKKLMEGIDMLYIVTGLGGGTGTGGTPAIAKLAKEMGAIVISSVTMPFKVEGARIGKAEDGLYQLRQVCDTVIVIENDKLLNVAGNLPIQQAFAVADDLIANMIKGVTETISQPSLVNLDYADVRTIMHSGGVATVGFGESDTKNRAEECIIKAMTNPLLEVDYHGGSGALIHVTGGNELRLDEVNQIGEYVSKQLDPEAQVIWGARIDENYGSKMKVITIVTGVKSPYILGPVAAQEEGERDVSKELGIPILK
ncbi:MAG: cell division protein FtsZ [Candidatus Aenigmarchaeota archaeon]|nr:cell division protein FtsZ [Candidatus Aenigmarchaeota archaeon]NIP40671.1 cell division protein FtsZ [Candidatus Aenigmarchaeota archaeon]NIQ18477.1 cell division protein FtsZ [Candidatus Aenigmarchaeota archaeon]NIS73376.1 cell division protein FtsZ [Candidatus Aenigmarchaeota archaeon]